MMQASIIEPWERLSLLENEILRLVPPIVPPECNWLESDAGPSYCRQHAWEARWKELPTIGACPSEPDWFRRNEFEDHVADGIGCSGCDSESDTPEHCEVCGCTLGYLLTKEGQLSELDHFNENPVSLGEQISGELTYALSRIFMNLDSPHADPLMVLDAVGLAEDTLAAIKARAAYEAAKEGGK